jgi:hypothetical protein
MNEFDGPIADAFEAVNRLRKLARGFEVIPHRVELCTNLGEFHYSLSFQGLNFLIRSLASTPPFQ